MDINGEMIRRVWQKAAEIQGQDSDTYRMDVSGTWIKLKEFNNTDSIYGWTIYSLDGSEKSLANMNQLIPVHTYNNKVPLAGVMTTSDTHLSDLIF